MGITHLYLPLATGLPLGVKGWDQRVVVFGIVSIAKTGAELKFIGNLQAQVDPRIQGIRPSVAQGFVQAYSSKYQVTNIYKKFWFGAYEFFIKRIIFFCNC